MIKFKFFVVSAIAGILLLGANFAAALEPIPEESGFSGFVQPGAGYLWFKSNMVASFFNYDLSKKTTHSLNDSPDSQTTGVVLAPFALRYTFASTRTQFFLGTDLTNLIRFDYSQQLGIKQEIGKLGLLQGGILASGIPAKVWKDPYAVNTNRKETSRQSNGARLVWDRIGGSQLQLQYTYRHIDISSEKSGNSLALTQSQRRRLRRDGDSQEAQVLYRFKLDNRQILAPAFTYTYDDREGSAMKNDAYDFQLTYTYLGDPITFTATGSIGWADYDKKNPIYGKTENDDNYAIQSIVYYKNPWNWRLFGSNPMNFYINAAYAYNNANIDFYDQEAFLATAGVLFRW